MRCAASRTLRKDEFDTKEFVTVYNVAKRNNFILTVSG
jgi:hypothetical protein